MAYLPLDFFWSLYLFIYVIVHVFAMALKCEILFASIFLGI